MFTLAELEAAAGLVHARMPPTPAHAWPLLAGRTGAEVWIKHENHTPTGAFKLRGGLVYLDELARAEPGCPGLVTATRGNHGQSIPFAARAHGLPVTVYVPEGNATDKNRAMQAWGARLVVEGHDFEAARLASVAHAEAAGLHLVPSYHPLLVRGVATYALELFRDVPDLDAVYVPIGLGSGISGLIRTRDLLGLKTEIVGVVAAGADAYARAFEAGRPVATERAVSFADGMACRVPVPEAVAVICRGAARVLRLSEPELAAAVRMLFADTHNVAEGAGAAAFAGLWQERERMAGKRVAAILCGGNIDAAWFAEILSGGVPVPA
ncbi:threonine dehydratase [Paralimibaculum aggregatum]|uniref:Threonine dehydratase n=1 Tax=Paralimibaculum aggregatum TaxID=3036245 RepID=A0ABQ6LPE7_9RHOB|nr:threonine dehydratase [Limibaculum sp. NKW23]GMG82195.1 threonine dehydratase [Limibaculum sp. NKW23]